MFPCEIELEVKEKIFTKVNVLTWITAMQKIQEIKIYLKRFQQIIQIEPSKSCTDTFELFCKKHKRKLKIYGPNSLCVRAL